ncbi:hypothetical protein ATANTOWER_006883 [Ataeniobius toweri]|uniref:Uncharacterized protein n=1 Tax=Ataeniobius toweri TaxID=208326 RepID=A0ABU7AV22_9TELE|nr:hypothetical protein [Ataeniobius toweri]
MMFCWKVNNLAERHCPDHLEDKQWQPLHFWTNRGGNYAGERDRRIFSMCRSTNLKIRKSGIFEPSCLDTLEPENPVSSILSVMFFEAE